jgi:hypothetical protein
MHAGHTALRANGVEYSFTPQSAEALVSPLAPDVSSHHKSHESHESAASCSLQARLVLSGLICALPRCCTNPPALHSGERSSHASAARTAGTWLRAPLQRNFHVDPKIPRIWLRRMSWPLYKRRIAIEGFPDVMLCARFFALL